MKSLFSSADGKILERIQGAVLTTQSALSGAGNQNDPTKGGPEDINKSAHQSTTFNN